MTAYLYTRKSVVRDDTPTHSPQVQEERLRALALAHGDAEPVVLSDLGISGAEVDRRPGYVDLVEAIEDGRATAVYAYDLSRLHRNAGESDRFWKLIAERDVPVYLTDMTVDPKTATGRLIIGMFAQVNAWQREVTSEKLKATFARKRANGEKLGGRYYGDRDGEDAQAVVDAYRDTGSLAKAARALNAASLPTRNRRSRGWSPAAVQVVVRRLAPDLLPDRTSNPKGAPAHGDKRHALARLLRCGVCGAMMSASVDRGTYTRYYCHNAYLDGRHARRGGVQERALLPLVRAEADRLVALYQRRLSRGTPEDAMTLAELQRQREDTGYALSRGMLSREQADARMAEVEQAESRLSALRYFHRIQVPPVIEPEDGVAADPPGRVNAWLRRVFDHVDVDLGTVVPRGQCPPLGFVWRDESLRGEA